MPAWSKAVSSLIFAGESRRGGEFAIGKSRLRNDGALVPLW
jgi:hypothetical protein